MPTFEFNKKPNNEQPAKAADAVLAAESKCAELDPRRLREECLISLKVYDSCRKQECLTEKEIGPARAADCGCLDGQHYREGEIIEPPRRAASVSICNLVIKKVLIVDKRPCQFKKGFWNIDIKFVFEYDLIFREADGCAYDPIRANSIFNRRVTLFGSVGGDIVSVTDLFGPMMGGEPMSNAEPNVFVEAKAVALSAELKHLRFSSRGDHDCDEHGADRVNVAIGLFIIVKLCRVVSLLVESKGFCTPPKCEDICPINPCDVFDDIDFPMDIFAPPQKPEFQAGICGNIPADKDKDCGC